MNGPITDKQKFLTLVKAWQQYTDSGLQASHLIGYIQTKYSYYPVHIGKYYGIVCSQLITTNGASATFWADLYTPNHQIFIFDVPAPLTN